MATAVDRRRYAVHTAEMSKRADVPPERAEAPVEGAPHVFDLTNGVLGVEHAAESGERGRGDRTPPSSFGVPPIVSL
jgi:hypothetical protein